MPQSEGERYMALFKKALSGSLGKNLIDIEFSTQQVMESEEHKLLADLRHSKLADDETAHKLYDKIISTLELDASYLILLAYDCYDVFSKSADGETETESTSVFNYFLCSVCPVKENEHIWTKG